MLIRFECGFEMSAGELHPRGREKTSMDVHYGLA